MLFRQLYDAKLSQYAYLIGCQQTGEALIVDPERDVERYLEAAASEGLTLVAVAETHIHADFLSGARELAAHHGLRAYLSDEGDADWKYGWADDAGSHVALLRDGDRFRVGHVELQAVHTPGHTPEHLAFLVTDRGSGATEPIGVLSGDFVFVGDVGRPDLLETAAGQSGAMEPSARRLYASLRWFLELPEYLQVWPAHGAGSACGKALGAVPETTVGYELRYSAALEAVRRGEEAFVAFVLEGQPEPPLYFARMKRENREGPELLGELPSPKKLSAEELWQEARRGEARVLDTRADRSAFMAGHLAGSLYAPLDRSFPTAVGSVLESATSPILLVVEERRREEAIRDLVRLGYDRIAGWVDPATLGAALGAGAPEASIPEIDFEALERQQREGAAVLDVRYRSEYAAGHVPGALHIPYTRLPLHADRLPADRLLLVHCASGARAAVAAAYLKSRGLDVWYVNDAIARYRERTVLEREGEVSVG